MRKFLLIPLLLGILISALFSLFVYPNVAGHIGNTPVADRYDDLARGIVSYGTLSYYPDSAPTVLRAPMYPLLLSLCMIIAGSHFAVLALIFQALLHGSTALIAALIAMHFAGRRAALITGILCAIHPLLLWYSGRLIVETLSTFLFTMSIFAVVKYWTRPLTIRAFALGASIGIGLWCKAVFASLFIPVIIAILLRRGDRRTLSHVAVIVCTGMLIIAPWIIRNYTLTERWPIFQALVGYNLYVSDSFVEHAAESPFGYAGLIKSIDYEGMNDGCTAADSLHSTAWFEAKRDEILTHRSIDRYINEPGFFFKKIVFNSIWIWTLGSTKSVSLFMAVFQGTLLILSFFSIRSILHRDGWKSVMLMPVWIGIAYIVIHISVYMLARFSLVMVPSLIAMIVSTYALHHADWNTRNVKRRRT